jgi:hypothetical protein
MEGRPRPRLPRRGRHRGQAAVLVALVLFTLVLFLALATNIGIVVNDRIRMQNTADLATYSAAYTEAQSLNELTYFNTRIASTVAQCREELVSTPWISCLCTDRHPAAEAIIMACQAELDALILEWVTTAEYSSSVSPALAAGRATAEANFANTSGSTSFMEDVPGSPTFLGQYWVNANFNFLGSISLPAIANYDQAGPILNYQHYVLCPCEDGCCFGWIAYPETQVQGWFWKSNADPEVWVEGRVYGAPKKQFLDVGYSPRGGNDGGFFGASSTGGTDLLYAYAVAKPFEGSVGPTRLSGMDQNGDWLMGQLYMPGPMGAMLDPETDLGMVEEYRARLAGMNEDLTGGSAPTDLAFMDGMMNLGRFWNTSYFKH